MYMQKKGDALAFCMQNWVNGPHFQNPQSTQWINFSVLHTDFTQKSWMFPVCRVNTPRLLLSHKPIWTPILPLPLNKLPAFTLTSCNLGSQFSVKTYAHECIKWKIHISDLQKQNGGQSPFHPPIRVGYFQTWLLPLLAIELKDKKKWNKCLFSSITESREIMSLWSFCWRKN